jgi:PhzF family phenazine biosynthesis protein
MRFWTVDAFTNEAFKGNPAAVCVLDQFLDDDLMQKIAAEVNLSETAFVVPKQNSHYDIRWFTPTIEVNLCGHATLAAAHILWNEEPATATSDIIYFDSYSGVLMAQKNGDSITLDFPSYQAEPMSMPDGLMDALGVAPVCISKAHDDWIVELHSTQEVRDLQPDIAKLATINCRGIIVTADGEEGEQYDFVSRFFAPRVGVNEDSVTGSAHCKLAPYWTERLGKNEFTAYQASKRGGVLKLKYDRERVYLTGEAVTVFRGRFLKF